ncbi:hypothetical protein F5Y09DRAFT_335254 [Xylaria sp. FL1042]|nr:hypothetical protein F5Y09DRAFT_335254 [Xylaria sp. FL1042]
MSTIFKLGHQRLLSDIHELVTKPYPKIALHLRENNLKQACLVLYPENYPPLHLTIDFPPRYPIDPPRVHVNSSVQHPNVSGGFICANILRVCDDYTPAYTLKGVAIQLLSFFDSDSVQQEYDEAVKLDTYRALNNLHPVETYECKKCSFGMKTKPWQLIAPCVPVDFNARVDQNSQRPTGGRGEDDQIDFNINRLPNEILLVIIESLDDFEHLTNFARAWSRISQLVRDFDVIRQRELQCFCLKKGYQSAKLGVEDGHSALTQIASRLRTLSSSGSLNAYVLFTFMNDIVVRLNESNEKIDRGVFKKSTLRHASEKAIDSYFHLFHLLVCLATEDPKMVQQANKLLRDFEDGRRSKTYCPNLGHLLTALLISDVQVTNALIKSIITEAIVRNVVWLLDKKGAVSTYRLDKTFQGSRTSYRLLMFSELFRRTARPSHEKTLIQVRDELFDRHGGPPRDAAGHLAAEMRRLHTIGNFPAFMREMGLQNIPTSKNFTTVLRDTVRESMARGYSKWAVNQEQAMRLRIQKDPHIQLTQEERNWAKFIDRRPANQRPSYDFFPGNRRRQA